MFLQDLTLSKYCKRCINKLSPSTLKKAFSQLFSELKIPSLEERRRSSCVPLVILLMAARSSLIPVTAEWSEGRSSLTSILTDRRDGREDPFPVHMERTGKDQSPPVLALWIKRKVRLHRSADPWKGQSCGNAGDPHTHPYLPLRRWRANDDPRRFLILSLHEKHRTSRRHIPIVENIFCGLCVSYNILCNIQVPVYEVAEVFFPLNPHCFISANFKKFLEWGQDFRISTDESATIFRYKGELTPPP